MLENAVRICDANLVIYLRWDGEALHLLATHNTPAAYAEFVGVTAVSSNPDLPFSAAWWPTKELVTSAIFRRSRSTSNNSIRSLVSAVTLVEYGPSWVFHC